MKSLQKKDIVERASKFVNTIANILDDTKNLKNIFEMWNELDEEIQNYILTQFIFTNNLNLSKQKMHYEKIIEKALPKNFNKS